MENLQESINQMHAGRVAFFDRAFSGMNVPPKIRRLSERICISYGISGTCDPGYIANIIALELGMGDGKGNFYPQYFE